MVSYVDLSFPTLKNHDNFKLISKVTVVTSSSILGDPGAGSRDRQCDIFRRKFTSRAEEPLST